MVSKKKSVKKRETFGIKFTKVELIHLRDLFSVMLPAKLNTTISQQLALIEGRTLTETKLWQKLAKKLDAAEIPTDEEAPDYTLGISSVPDISVFPIADNGDEHIVGREPYAPDEEEDDDK